MAALVAQCCWYACPHLPLLHTNNGLCWLKLGYQRRQKEKIWNNIFDKFIEKIFFDFTIFETTHQVYWKDTSKILCEFNFIIEGSSNEGLLKSHLLLLSRISNNWDITFGSQPLPDVIIDSSVCQNSKIIGIDWINIETST
ncbi:hypothetical protein [Ferruginibacter sp.]|nr:hypothetical protein [Ferruginibacter sp.]